MTVGDSLVTHPQATGAVTLECAIDSGAFAACSSSGWTADFAAFGAHNLHYRAIDAAGNSVVRTVSVVKPAPPTPPAVTDPPVTPPSVPTLPSATPAFAAIKAKPAKSTVTLPVMVTLALPSGTNAAAACNGSATLTVTVGKKVVKTVSVPLKLVKGKCQVTSALKIKSALIAGKKFSVSISFAGNAAIAKFYAAKQGKAGAAKK
jgi:hypothetical protein